MTLMATSRALGQPSRVAGLQLPARQRLSPSPVSTGIGALRKPRHGCGLGLAPVEGLGLLRQNRCERDTQVAGASASFEVVPETDFKESGRKLMRHVFDPDRWLVHRSTSRYFRHIAGLFNSRLLLGLAQPLLYVVMIATAVCAYHAAFQAGMLPATLPDLQIKNKELFGLTSFALSLLLVFRTNASYERWDGARKLWGLVLNRSRDLARQGLAWIPDEKSELRAMLCRWVPAFSKALMCHLRKGENIQKELDGVLLPHEIAGVVKATHRPNYVLQVLSQIIKSASLPTAPTIRMEDNLTNFEDCLGGCERILRTPIPLYYTRHTSRFLMIWLTLLPFTLVGSSGWATIPLSFIIAFLLLGVEEIGVAIEEPFGVLALETISGTALTNIRELESMHATSALAGGSAEVEVAVAATDMVSLAELAAKKGQLEAAVAVNGGAQFVSANGNGNGTK